MIAISNQQRDEIIRYIDYMCETNKDVSSRNTRVFNLCRRAKILRRELMKKTSFSASELPEKLKKSRISK
jgi:hypothetical protein|nr:MAG TPA: hypothetical protein [Caudoviricetes sp.]